MKSYPQQFIGGEWREGRGSAQLVDINPFTGETIYTYRSAGVSDVDQAYEAAREAQLAWVKKTPAEQQEALKKLIEAIISMKEDIYTCLTEEGGAPQARADYEFFMSISIIESSLQFPLMLEGKIMPSNTPGKDNYVVRQPRGVIGVITPWNVPIVLAMRSIIPAIAAGNAVVLKPSSETPAAAFLIAEFFEKAGMPKGLLNVVAGSGAEIGDYFVEHPIPSLISFTGSTEVGRRIGQKAGGMVKEVSLELGGNGAMIVLADADISHAVGAAIFSAFFNQGQVCMALNRIIILDEVYDAFAAAFAEAASHLTVGDPHDPSTFMGPLINKEQVAKVEAYVKGSIDAGARVLLEGRTEGSLMYPWVLGEVTNDMPTAQHEVFGPVCSLIRAASEEEALLIANDTTYGLSGSVFTTDLYHGLQLAKRMECGMVHVNDQPINDEPHVMFGGEKQSGVGRFNGTWVLEKFTTEKWISVQTEYRF